MDCKMIDRLEQAFPESYRNGDILMIHGDCLEKMKDIPDKSIDMILADLPYGSTACKWDVVIPFEPLWEQYKRIIKDRGAIVLFGNQPFTSKLIASNIEQFKYCWYWKKERGTGFALSGKRPLMIVEDIVVFYAKQPTYNPKKTKLDKPYIHALPIVKSASGGKDNLNNLTANGERIYKEYTHSLPHQLLEFSRDKGGHGRHPTQKPIQLLEYLIKTYTIEGETVLDNCMGSGSTGVACINTKRNFIGIEKDDKYFEIAKKRIEEAQNANA